MMEYIHSAKWHTTNTPTRMFCTTLAFYLSNECTTASTTVLVNISRQLTMRTMR